MVRVRKFGECFLYSGFLLVISKYWFLMEYGYDYFFMSLNILLVNYKKC